VFGIPRSRSASSRRSSAARSAADCGPGRTPPSRRWPPARPAVRSSSSCRAGNSTSAPVSGSRTSTGSAWAATRLLFIFRETLPETVRTTGGLAQTGRDFRRLLSDRIVLGTVLVTGLISVALFAYLVGATYVLQDISGLSPQGYSFAFGLNSLGFMVFGFAGGRLCAR
jgi:hypothetical protein